ncbi:MAG TPA: hypothetical protein DEP72_03505 [Clostridiales bacterium]|nr:MAG: hypothetical protein A2Y18_00675 [Clostridiales bacterium GWD2_32_19]HCC07219.1 hypothetical protein [Clostridiales bacterium]
MRRRAQGIIIRNNMALFGYGKSNNEFKHAFIGGGIEGQEEPEEALIRELREETNIEGKIIFKFKNEIKEERYTFLVDIGDQQCILGFDPEEVSLPDEEKSLQQLIWIPLKEKDRFTSIDMSYFKLLLEECKGINYYPDWLSELKELVT